MSCSVGHRHSLDPALPWLWRGLAAVALIRPLAWERLCVMGAALKKKKKKWFSFVTCFFFPSTTRTGILHSQLCWGWDFPKEMRRMGCWGHLSAHGNKAFIFSERRGKWDAVYFFIKCQDFFFCFAFFRAASMPYESSQARGQIRAAASSLHHSHSNSRSQPHPWPTLQFTAMLDLEPTEQDQGSNPHPHSY